MAQYRPIALMSFGGGPSRQVAASLLYVCLSCGRGLCETDVTMSQEVRIKCRRCGTMNNLNSTSPVRPVADLTQSGVGSNGNK